MITARVISQGGSYNSKHLKYSDYVDEQRRVAGRWIGRGAERLGLSGDVDDQSFERLRLGMHPATGEKLRQKVFAEGQPQARSMYDFVWSAPKSVSTQTVVGGDGRLSKAHQAAVLEAIPVLESLAETRVRSAGRNDNRVTGNLVGSLWDHDTSRSLDPQVHTHCVLFNITHDPVEGRYKALQAGSMYERTSYVTEVYRNALAREVQRLGYEVETVRDARGRDRGFEIIGISRAIRERFSQRSEDRDRAIAAFKRERARAPTKREIAVLVRESRRDKLLEIATAEVRAKQRARLSADELATLEGLKEYALRTGVLSKREAMSARSALDFAEGHIFERLSVTSRYELLAEALRHGRGRIDHGDLLQTFESRVSAGHYVTVPGRNGGVATRETLLRECEMVNQISRGLGACGPLGQVDGALPAHLSAGQRQAIEGILGSRDRIVALEGAAGTGKSDVLAHLRLGAERGGYNVIALAPTASAVDELRARGFKDAVTVERFLVDSSLQQARGKHFVVVDEAGMVGAKKMAELLAVTERSRVLLSGDTRQLKSVEAGDALRILQKESRLPVFRLEAVFRQSGSYRKAVEALRWNPGKGLELLEQLGAVRVVSEEKRAEAAVAQYLEWTHAPNRKGERAKVLAVAPTWEEIRTFTTTLRTELKNKGSLKTGVSIDTLKALNWTEAERRSVQLYQAGQVLVFHRPTKSGLWGGIAKNEAVTVEGQEKGKLFVRRQNGKRATITKKQAKCFGVYERHTIEVSAGERLLFQTNRQAPRATALRQLGDKLGWKQFRATNGEIVQVKKVSLRGDIELTDGRKIPHDYRQFTYGYAVTAHASQGKTVDRVLVMGDHMRQEHFYVAATRAREDVAVMTSDLGQFRASIQESTERTSATELAQQQQDSRQDRQRLAAVHDKQHQSSAQSDSARSAQMGA